MLPQQGCIVKMVEGARSDKCPEEGIWLKFAMLVNPHKPDDKEGEK